MKKIFLKFIASLAICGLAALSASPAYASVEYDPNDPLFDPSGTYDEYIQSVAKNSDESSAATKENVTSESDQTGGDQSGLSTTEEPSGDQLSENSSTDNSESDTGSPINIEAGNIETGSESENNGQSSVDESTVTDVVNQADLDNQVEATANSGQNTSNANTGNGEVDTGDADLAANIISSTNTVVEGTESMALPIINMFSDFVGDLVFDQNHDNLSGEDLNLLQVLSNLFTGSDSANQSESKYNNSNTTNVDNQSNLNNGLALEAITGQNNASYNTGDGSVKTGDANIAANVVNFLNNSIFASNWWLGMINIFGDWTGNLVLPSLNGSSTSQINQEAMNSQTGNSSENLVSNNLEVNSELGIQNDASLIDEIVIDANTGNNESSYNTLDGNINTGNANIKDNQLTVANNTVVGDSWWMFLVNTLEGWTGAVIGSPIAGIQFLPFVFGSEVANVETGSDSQNLSVSENTIENSADIQNQATTNNQLYLSADTGNNQASYNTGNGTIDTGNANIMSNLVNFVNNTFNVKNWSFGILNIFGKWDGGISFGEQASQNTSSSQSFETRNEETGANSSNDTQNSIESQMNINIDNNLSIRKDLRADINTGNNKTEGNTGDGTIDTGDIDFVSSMAAYGNITDITLEGNEELKFKNGNSETGGNSENNSTTNWFDKFVITVSNAVCYVKDITLNLETGNNSSDKNTGDGEVTTGDIRVKIKEKDVFNVVKISKEKPEKPEQPEEPEVPEKPEKPEQPEVPEAGGEVLPPVEIQEVLGEMVELLPVTGADTLIISGIMSLIIYMFVRRKLF